MDQGLRLLAVYPCRNTGGALCFYFVQDKERVKLHLCDQTYGIAATFKCGSHCLDIDLALY